MQPIANLMCVTFSYVPLPHRNCWSYCQEVLSKTAYFVFYTQWWYAVMIKIRSTAYYTQWTAYLKLRILIIIIWMSWFLGEKRTIHHHHHLSSLLSGMCFLHLQFVCVCVCVYVHLCVYVCAYVHMCTCVCADVFMYSYNQTHCIPAPPPSPTHTHKRKTHRIVYLPSCYTSLPPPSISSPHTRTHAHTHTHTHTTPNTRLCSSVFMLHSIFPPPPVLQFVAVCCSVLQCAAVCCSVLHCAALCYIQFLPPPPPPLPPCTNPHTPHAKRTQTAHLPSFARNVNWIFGFCWYGVATVSRIDKIICFFCRISSF